MPAKFMAPRGATQHARGSAPLNSAPMPSVARISEMMRPAQRHGRSVLGAGTLGHGRAWILQRTRVCTLRDNCLSNATVRGMPSY